MTNYIDKIIDFHLKRNTDSYRNIIYYDKLNILYSVIKKNASSTLTYSLGVHNKINKICDINIDSKRFHAPHPYSRPYLLKNYVDIENANKIIVLRNPFSRLVSNYLRCFVYNDTNYTKTLQKKITNSIVNDISNKFIDKNPFYPPHTHIWLHTE